MSLPHPVEYQLVDGVNLADYLSVAHSVANRYGYGARVLKAFVMPEEHSFIAELNLLIANTNLHQRNRRRGRGIKDLPRRVTDMRALIQAGFAGGKGHGECQAGGLTTILTVRLGQLFKNL